MAALHGIPPGCLADPGTENSVQTGGMKEMKLRLLALAAAGFAAAALDPHAASAEEPINIGVIANLTGSDVKSSVDMVRGVELAAATINAAGGIKGRPIKLIVEDAEYRPQAGLDAATKLFDVDKVDAAVVFGGSSITIPIAEMAGPKGKIIMNTSASSSKLGNYSGTVYSTLPLDDIVGKALGDYVASKGVKTAAFVVPNNTFGTGLMDAATKEFEAKGGKVLRKVIYTEGQPDYRADMQAVLQAKPEAIMSAGYGDDTRTIFKAARELGIDAPWYAAYPSIFYVENEQWMNGKLSGVDNGGLSSPVGQQIKKAYADKFKGDPLPHYYYGYDALMLLAKAMIAGGTDPAAIKKALPAGVKGYDGATGSIEWDDRGQRVNPPMDYFIYKDSKLQPIPQ
jgi:branched-chain amino acid transport system substrate-binding protein